MEWIWLFVIIIAVILDFATSDFIFAGFGVGAILALILSVFEISIPIQIITFGVVGALFIFAIYPIIKKKIKKENLGTKVMEANYIGQTVILDKDITTEILMKFEGIYWTFKNTEDESIKKGDTAEITGISGNKLLIKKNKI
ncbi:NfeD family protein [uncultured Clostridium sp.]|jgi:membrane protein implicated in regulation of membrane protease activity|uniref:NfeD family protein n=1 Tax=uncultured Clostridium sp. TaxID=59620 RepID=UPI002633CF09|nr:NfeD family protein [uncultured Clostridium sp.]